MDPFTLGDALKREAHARPFDRSQRLEADGRDRLPATRRLTVFTQDPATPRMQVSIADAVVPFEPLGPGPEGAVIRVIDRNESAKETYDPVALDALGVIAPT